MKGVKYTAYQLVFRKLLPGLQSPSARLNIYIYVRVHFFPNFKHCEMSEGFVDDDNLLNPLRKLESNH